jgi:hypothetical protein
MQDPSSAGASSEEAFGDKARLGATTCLFVLVAKSGRLVLTARSLLGSGRGRPRRIIRCDDLGRLGVAFL